MMPLYKQFFTTTKYHFDSYMQDDILLSKASRTISHTKHLKYINAMHIANNISGKVLLYFVPIVALGWSSKMPNSKSSSVVWVSYS